MKKPILICVVGPTAIGKTSMAIALAKAFSTEILSADSRQFYKEMKIGTAVPTEEELAAVPHHFIQNKSIFEDYSVGDFERDAVEFLKYKFEGQHTSHMIMVGGSGLYVDAVVKGLDTFPTIPSEVRDRLNSKLVSHGLAVLQQQLLVADPDYYSKVDIQNPHRVIRALEVIEHTGKPFSSFLGNHFPLRNFGTIYIGLTSDRETVYARINQRVDQMVADGLIEEAKKLYHHRTLSALQTVGYRELFEYFDGKITLEEAISEIKKNTRRFAKRQGTWFRKNTQINWFDYKTPPEDIIAFVKTKSHLKFP